jgi:hypothetical protein
VINEFKMCVGFRKLQLNAFIFVDVSKFMVYGPYVSNSTAGFNGTQLSHCLPSRIGGA